MAAMKASLELFTGVGMPALREKSEKLTAYLEYTIGLLTAEFPDGADFSQDKKSVSIGGELSLS